MASHNDTGKTGEMLAQQYLLDHDYAILHTNHRLGRDEADIIAYQEGLLVFVEVKTRTSTLLTEPEDAVDLKKQRSYVRMANAYVLEHRREEEVRFDIITVVIRALDDVEISHLQNAFSPHEL